MLNILIKMLIIWELQLTLIIWIALFYVFYWAFQAVSVVIWLHCRFYLQNPDVGFRENDRALSRIESPLPLLPERPMDHPFQGLLASQLECMECGYKNPVRYDHFDSLSLTFPQSVWVCPKMFTLSEVIALII